VESPLGRRDATRKCSLIVRETVPTFASSVTDCARYRATFAQSTATIMMIVRDRARIAREFRSIGGRSSQGRAEMWASSSPIFAQSRRSLRRSRRVFAHSRRVFTHSRRIFAHSRRIFAHSRRVFARSRRVFARSRRVFARSRRVFAHSRPIIARSSAMYADIAPDLRSFASKYRRHRG
jgi:hypothetical protein